MTARFPPISRRAVAGSIAAVCAALALGGNALANTWPEKTVTLVVPYSAGGPTDVVARLLAVPMGQSLGQTVVVENTVGAGGTLAPARIVRSKPDGYTILIHHMGMATAPALYKKLPYDPLKDFEYIGQVLDVPMTLLSRKDFPANNFQELLAYVKANQEKVSLANAGIGAVSQLCGMLFMHQIGVKLTTVPYKGAGPAMNDLLGGQVDLYFASLTASLPQIAAGKIRPLAVSSEKRHAALPQVATLAELGFPSLTYTAFYGVVAPARTPEGVLDLLNKQINNALDTDEVRAVFAKQGITPQLISRTQFASFLAAERAKWSAVVKKTGATVD